MIAVAEKFTYSKYLQLDDDRRYEIIDGELFDISPAPTLKHQAISRNLQRLIIDYVYSKKLGHVFNAPSDVRFDEYNVVQPDLIFVSHANEGILTERNINGSPDLLVEILSPSTFHHDQERKKALYEKFGVKEFWVVDPANEVIDIFALNNGKYELLAFASQKGTVDSSVLKGFSVTIEQIRAKEFDKK
ncbi:MAG: Uma2 family endonuclease [Imperialibacter sp.]|uniref:Uma2 family endonuclease n=1 Tax=Imperialibacter sp. TaxID=2038411 RepID=UPI003A87637E